MEPSVLLLLVVVSRGTNVKAIDIVRLLVTAISALGRHSKVRERILRLVLALTEWP